jgi:Rieske 2Fe-2S family protein
VDGRVVNGRVVNAPTSLERSLTSHRPGHALTREFHLDPEIYEHELSTIWRRSWLLAGLASEVASTGDFFRFDLGDDSIIVVRGEGERLHALHNTCRHRGMAVCSEASGNARRWVCPYHQWSYALDGSHLGSGGMERQIDAAAYGLRRAEVFEVGGLVFVWPDADVEPEPFDEAQAELARALVHQGLGQAKVAHQIEYRVAANWKLIWENNRECWHCHVGHPQYVKANFDSLPDTRHVRELALSRAHEHGLLLGDDGDVDEHAEPGLYRFPSAGRWWSANRTPLVPGFVTESLTGEPVAPLMGDHRDYDVGTLRVRTVPNFWSHMSADHAVLTRLLPAGPGTTLVRVQWLVDRDAVAGRDYELEQLLPFWQLTSEQDWDLCQRNHAGVRNPAYLPGPYSLTREYNVAAFIDWYLARLAVTG